MKFPSWIQGQVISFALTLTAFAAQTSGAQLDTGFDPGPRADLDILSLAVQADGRIIAAGEFTVIGGTNRSRIVRLHPDGSVDSSFASSQELIGTVRAAAIQGDGAIVIGGEFFSADGSARSIARLHPNGDMDSSFAARTNILNPVRALAIQPDGKILIGGLFTSVGEVDRQNIARLNPDGSLDASFDPGAGANNWPRALLLQPDGKILVAGRFTTFDNQPAGRIVRLRADGSLDPDFNPGLGAEAPIRALALDLGGRIYIGGEFEMFNGTNRSGVARLHPDGSLDLSFDQGDPDEDTINALAVGPDGKIWIGGLFQEAGGQPRALLARLNENGTADPAINVTFDNRTGDEMYALTFQRDGLLLVAGEFRSVNGVTRQRLARLVTPEAPALIRLGPGSFTSGVEGSTLTFTVERIGRTNAAASAAFATQNGSAQGGLDFTATNGTVQFAPGEISKAVIVSLLPDLVFDPNEDFKMELSNLQGAAPGNPISATARIVENSPRIEMVTSQIYQSREGVSMDSIEAAIASVQFLRFGDAVGQTWSVDYEIIPGTATHGQDFTGPLHGTVESTVGNDYRSILIPLVNDGRPEPDESFTVRLTGAVGAVIGPNNVAMVSILDDDGPIQWVASQYRAAETSRTTEVVIRRSDNGAEPASVTYTIKSDTASSDDFVPQQGTLTFAPLEKTKTLTVTLFDDCRIEPDESVNLVLTEATGEPGLGVNANCHLIIQDDERPGSFDLTFGTNGLLAISSGPLARHTDGAVLVGATRTGGRVYRILRDGTVDPNFAGTNFMPRVSGLFANWPFQLGYVRQMFVQPDGGILVRGRTELVLFPDGPPPDGFTNHLTRLHPDGRLDSSFALDKRVPLPQWEWEPTVLQPAPDGKVLIATSPRTDDGQPLASHLVRLNRDGSLDATFRASLQAPFQFYTPLRALAVQPDGRILVGGVFLRGGNVFPGVLRLTQDGSMDGQFAPVEFQWSSISTNPEPRSMVIQPDGRILISGNFGQVNSSAKTNLARIHADGYVDESFQVEEALQIYYNDPRPIALDAEGRIMIVRAFQTFQPVARLLPDGRRDPSFSMNEGRWPFASTVTDVTDMVVTDEGKVVFANYTGVFRLNGNATPIIALTPNPTSPGWRLSTPTITGDTYRLQSTRDFSAWTTLQTQTASGCSVEFLVEPNLPPQFYRIERLPTP